MGVGVISPGVGWDKIFFFCRSRMGQERKCSPMWSSSSPEEAGAQAHLPLSHPPAWRRLHLSPLCCWLLLSLMPSRIAANRRVESHHILPTTAQEDAQWIGAPFASSKQQKLNMQMCHTDAWRNNKLKVVQHFFLFFFIFWLQVRHPCRQLSAAGLCPPQQCAQAWLAGRVFFFSVSVLVLLTRRAGQLSAFQWKHRHGFLAKRLPAEILAYLINNNNVMQMQCSLHSASFGSGLK